MQENLAQRLFFRDKVRRLGGGKCRVKGATGVFDERSAEESSVDETVADALESLEGDLHRKGHLGADDVSRVVHKRELTLEQFDLLLREMKRRGIDVIETEERPCSSRNRRKSADAPSYLTPEQEHTLANSIRLAARLEAEGNSESEFVTEGRRARDQFVVSNLRLVYWVANRWRGSRLAYEDLVQEGIKGLIKAVEMFDPDLGYKFSTYAYWWIQQAIRRGIDDLADEIRIPVHRLDQIRRYRKMVRRLRHEYGSEPTIHRAAAALGWTLELTGFIADLASFRTVEIDAPLTADSAVSIKDSLPDMREATPEERSMQTALRNVLETMLADLRPRERDIVMRRFGLETGVPRTLEDIGQEYGVTRERIRQIEAKALAKLRHPSRARALRTFIED
jgi:RNA polymerase primary sigma factor